MLLISIKSVMQCSNTNSIKSIVCIRHVNAMSWSFKSRYYRGKLSVVILFPYHFLQTWEETAKTHSHVYVFVLKCYANQHIVDKCLKNSPSYPLATFHGGILPSSPVINRCVKDISTCSCCLLWLSDTCIRLSINCQDQWCEADSSLNKFKIKTPQTRLVIPSVQFYLYLLPCHQFLLLQLLLWNLQDKLRVINPSVSHRTQHCSYRWAAQT